MKRFFTHRLVLAILLLITSLNANATKTLLADFEDGTWGLLTKGNDFSGTLFSTKPSIIENPCVSGVNTSSKCAGAVNVADADWWQNFLILKLNSPVVITEENRLLVLDAYRSIQPKDMRIGFNTYEETGSVYEGTLSSNATWETLTIDLGENYMGQTLSTLYIVLSCNWSEPRSGWGEATYCFDNIMLCAPADLPAITATINMNCALQTIKDFGASDCWTVDYVGKYFSDTEKAKAAEWLFSKETDASGNPLGIGLSCWRVNVGAGSATQGSNSNIENETRRTECFLNEDGTYDWTRQSGQQWFMQQAKNYGVDHFLLFSNSAPIYYTNNGLANASANATCNLKSDCFDDFARFLTTVTKHFSDEGYPITYIDPLNEPQWEWTSGQEGSPWTNNDIANLTKELDTAITEKRLSVKTLLPEAASWEYLTGGSGNAANQIWNFFDTNSSNYIGNLTTLEQAVAGHSYWTFTDNSTLSTTRKAVAEQAAKYGVEVMQTEWSMLDSAPSTSAGFPASYDDATKMDIALYMAKIIYTDLVYANATSWSYWTSMDQEKYSQKNRFHLLRLNATGDTGDESYSDIKNGGTVNADKNLWVLGNYSRFIRPGYKRVETSGLDSLNALMGTAFLAPDGNELVVVVVNMSKWVKNLSLNIGGGQTYGVSAYLTDADHDLALYANVNDIANMQVPARSVLTIKVALSESSGISEPTIPAISNTDAHIYNLQGQRITNPQQGTIYIRDGKKFIAQ